MMEAVSYFFQVFRNSRFGEKTYEILTLETNTKFGCQVVCQGKLQMCKECVAMCCDSTR